MYRFLKEMNTDGEVEVKVHGVLADYDLSSWTRDLKSDYTKTSEQRTGTPPYMAHELLTGTSPLHLYRHDIESLFNIVLLMGARHTIGTPKGEEKPRVIMRGSRALPYEKWFNETCYLTLGLHKGALFSQMQTIQLSPVFEDFRPWLEDLQSCFSDGFKQKPYATNKRPLPSWRTPAKSTAAQFDDETLGGHITYATVITPIPYLTGKLKGLVIRDPQSSSALAGSTPAGATRADD